MAKKKIMSKDIVMYSMIIVSILVTGVLGYNVYHIMSKDTVVEETQVGPTIKNDLYTLANNPTDYQRELFDELTASVEANDPYLTAEYVVKSFIADFFTWTNKEGNYEVGGLTYIFSPASTVFQAGVRNDMYSDLDAYIHQYGSENLLEVVSISIGGVVDAEDYTFNGEVYKAYYIEAGWEYSSTGTLDTDEFQKTGYFTVVDNNGRLEIVRFFDSY